GAAIRMDESEHPTAHLRRRVERTLSGELVPVVEARGALRVREDLARESIVVDEDPGDANSLGLLVVVPVCVVVATDLVFLNAGGGRRVQDRRAEGAGERFADPPGGARDVREPALLRILGGEELREENPVDEATAN